MSSSLLSSDNPDMRELARYNEMAKQAECEHVSLRRIVGDDYYFILCNDCGKRDPKPKRKLKGCMCSWPQDRFFYPSRDCEIHHG